MRIAWALILANLVTVATAVSQTRTDAPQLQVPRLVRINGTLTPDGITDVMGVTFAVYEEQQGGTPLWLETQNVHVDAQGHYSVLLGSQDAEGIPADLFYSNTARWLGVKVSGHDELPRVMFVSVPYALKARDAETLGGLPPSAFVQSGMSFSGAAAPTSYVVNPNTLDTGASGGTTNQLARWTNSTTLGNSIIFDNGTSVGINTTSPQATLDVNGTPIFRSPITTFTTSNSFGPQFAFSNNASPTGASWRFGVPGFANATSFFIYDYVSQNAPFTMERGAGLNSLYFKAGGNVGMGTSNPTSRLTVTGTIESTSGGFKFPDGSTLTSATSQGASSFTGNTVNQIIAVTQAGTGTAANFTAQGSGSAANFTASNATQTISAVQNGAGVSQFNASGVPAAVRGDSTTNTGSAAGVFGSSSSYLGYGVSGVNLSTCDPNDLIHCNAMGVFGFSASATRGAGVWGEAETLTGDNAGVVGKSLSSSGTGVFGFANATSGDATGVYGLSNASGGAGVFGEVNSASGTPAAVYGLVSVGTGAGAQLDVQTGNIIVGRSWNGSAFANSFRVAADGTTYGKVFNTTGADFAESVAVNGGKSLYNPGDVLIVDESGTRRFALANEPYSTKVAGIYATKPGVLASTHQDGDPQLKEEVPLAIVGIVPCKVSAENGAIKAGDMLVASSRPGYAMKGTDRSRMLGAVIGKALGSLDKGTGVIEVLVSLH